MEEMKDLLRELPSSFDFETNDFKGQRVVNGTIKKLQKDDELEPKSDEEQIKLTNFISYLYSLSGDLEKALEYCQKSLEIDPKNLTANVNKCHFLLQNDNVSDAGRVLQGIMELKKENGFQKRQADAKADLAYAYSRAGPLYHERAVRTYREVIPDYPEQYNWKYGLATMLVRQTHLLYTNVKNIQQHKKEISLHALNLLIEVAKCTNKTDKILCGKAWLQMGVIFFRNLFSKYDLLQIRWPEEFYDVTAKTCFDTALCMCPSDPFVLQRSGQHYRYNSLIDLGKSEKLLRKALELHNTSCFANHHLALTLKKKVEFEQEHFTRSLSDPGAFEGLSKSSATGNACQRSDFDTMDGMKSALLEAQLDTEKQSPRFAQNQDEQEMNVNRCHSTTWGSYNSTYSNQRGRTPRRHFYHNPHRRGSYQHQHSHPSYSASSSPTPSIYRSDQYVEKVFSSEQQNYGRSRYRDRSSRQRFAESGRFVRGRGWSSMVRGSPANCIKNPTKVIVYPDHPVLLEALGYLKRAVEISPGSSIMYDLALLYRMLDKSDEALKILNEITNLKEKHTSEKVLLQVYEQKGMCNFDLMRKAILPEERDKYSTNAKAMLCIAIERQAKFVKEEELKNAWHSYPTLKSLLEAKADCPSMKMLAKAHNMMKEHDEAIKVLETLKQEGELATKEYEDLIASYISVQDFQHAMLLLKFLQCTEQFKQLDRSLVVEAYIKGALHALNLKDTPTAVLRFRDAYNTAESYKSDNIDKAANHISRDQKRQKQLYELHIVHKCSLEDNCSFLEQLSNLFEENTDLKITVNTEDCLGQPGLSAMCYTMRNTENIVVVVHSETTQSHARTEVLCNQALVASEKSGANIVVVIPQNGSVPDVLDLPNINVVLLPPTTTSDELQQSVQNMEQKLVILQKLFQALCKLE